MRSLQPMKAPSDTVTEEYLASLAYPRYVSPKLDGLRARGLGHAPASKTNKRFRNEHVNELFGHLAVECLDGELIVGAPTGGDVLSRTNSGVTTREGKPDVRWYVFDNYLDPSLTFAKRIAELPKRLKLVPGEARKRIVVVEHRLVRNVGELLKAEEQFLREEYEGVMVNDPLAPYKFGRCTMKEAYLLKLKRFVDCEVRVTAVEEGEHNLNESTVREDGARRKSTRKEGKVASGMVGRIIGRVVGSGKPITLGPGRMPVHDRIHYLAHPGEIVGKVVKARYFHRPGAEPSYPNFQAFQHAVERR